MLNYVNFTFTAKPARIRAANETFYRKTIAPRGETVVEK